jgi:hypothetical protein
MIETYRMLGREHEADLAREAEKRHRASLVRAATRESAQPLRRARRRRLDMELIRRQLLLRSNPSS